LLTLSEASMGEILVCVVMTIVIYAFMIVAYKKGW
jgi:hypothetical protein